MVRPGRQERGSAIVELPLVLGLLVLPFGLLVLTLPTWVERQTAARDAAAEVARTLVVSTSSTSDDAGLRDVETLLRQIEAGYELSPGSLRLDAPPTVNPGEAVTVRVTVVLPGPRLPLFGSLGRRSWTVEHTERAPDYASFTE